MHLTKRLFFLTALVVIFFGFWQPTITLAANKEAYSTYQIVAEEESGELFYLQDSERFQNMQKPVVAVALGGGGARALVNVGILKALEEEDITVDLVVGSSMGAIVAVLYGSGMPLKTIEELLTSDILPSMFDFNFPFLHSVIDTRRVNFFMEKVSSHSRLEEFPILTALLSYDLTNGVKYVHTTGRVSREIQGSYSIPIFFPVVDYDGLFLMDPGILELTPAQTAKLLGAEVVISTTAFDDLPYDTYDYPVRAWTRFINILKERNSKAIIDRYSDLTINCDVGDYSFMDYHLAAEFIGLGYREAQKLIPELKQVLIAKQIPLRSTGVKEASGTKETGHQLDLERVLSDIKYERLQYDFTRIQPLLYYGRDHSFFRQELLREELSALQYGFLWQKGRFELRALTQGTEFDHFQSKLKWIGLTPNIDLIGSVYYQDSSVDQSWSYRMDLKYYQPKFTFTMGWADLEQTQYLHNAGSFALNWGKHRWQGEVELYTPFAEGGLKAKGLKYVSAQTIGIALGTDFTLQPKVVASNTEKTELFSHPIIYRGSEVEDSRTANLVQSSLELAYHYRFPYSLELLQCIQLKEVTCFPFIDLYYKSNPHYALGVGLEVELSLLGIKPGSFGGYASYDLDHTTWQGGLSVDLAF